MSTKSVQFLQKQLVVRLYLKYPRRPSSPGDTRVVTDTHLQTAVLQASLANNDKAFSIEKDIVVDRQHGFKPVPISLASSSAQSKGYYIC